MSGGGKETPRQKMIGMMYLFYTALLALNVSAEVLSAFQLVDQSLRKTNANTEDVISARQAEFTKAMVNDSLGVLKWKQLADKVIIGADDAFNTIQNYKTLFVTTLEGKDVATLQTEAAEEINKNIENEAERKPRHGEAFLFISC